MTEKVKLREEISPESKWKIEKIYESIEDWNKDFDLLKNKAPELSKFSGKLGDASSLYEFLQLDEEVSRLAERLFMYAHLRSDEDTANTTFLALKDSVDSYMANLQAIGAFFTPEILSLKEGTIEKEIETNPDLEKYRFLFDKLLKLKPHTLTKELEEMLASVSDCLSAPQTIFNLLSNADMTFPVIKDEEGNDIELTESLYSKFIQSKNRDVRKSAFNALFSTYEKFKNTFAASLTSSVKNFAFESKTRKYETSLQCSLEPNDIPVEVYKKAVETINSNLKSLHRYVKIKKKLLKLDDIHMYDLYVPVIDVPKEHIEFDEGVKIAKEGLKPLGEEYLYIFSRGVESGWIDIYPNKGKRSGAYSWGSFDTLPYVLLNYNYALDDVSTLAHEMGHSIHSYYSRKTQPYIYADYTLFCAEVASTTNESLLIHHLIENEKDESRKLYLINSELEQIRTTVFRQIMFAEFELYTHENIEKGISLTAKDLCKFWHELNVKYFGPEMNVDDIIDMEWSRIPHFYTDFYVYQYATGYAAANSFARMILNKEDNAVERYKGFLKSGGSDYPINILKKAGVDMTTEKPIQDTIDRFNDLLDMLEK